MHDQEKLRIKFPGSNRILFHDVILVLLKKTQIHYELKKALIFIFILLLSISLQIYYI